jgi:hypothetical protein
MCPYACPILDARPQTVGVFEDDVVLLALTGPEAGRGPFDSDYLDTEIRPELWSYAWDL